MVCAGYSPLGRNFLRVGDVVSQLLIRVLLLARGQSKVCRRLSNRIVTGISMPIAGPGCAEGPRSVGVLGFDLGAVAGPLGVDCLLYTSPSPRD